jgi:uncharacterized membrane protein YcaP (DUF421 family)
MNIITDILGEGEVLSELEMCYRAIVIFIISLCLIRFSGRRAFGIRMPFDNVLTILLGAVLSRAITGASPFIATIVAASTIVILHRICGWLCLRNKKFGYLLKGEAKILFKDGEIQSANMRYGLISENDLMEGMRINGHLEDLNQIKTIYLERNGQISVIKKDN